MAILPGVVRAYARDFANAPDFVALPADEPRSRPSWTGRAARSRVVPFGAGSSVVGGMSLVGEALPAPWPRHAALTGCSKSTPRAAPPESRRASGDPRSRRRLTPWLRYAPLSAELRFSTLGGWIATRREVISPRFTPILTIFESLRTVTPAG